MVSNFMKTFASQPTTRIETQQPGDKICQNRLQIVTAPFAVNLFLNSNSFEPELGGDVFQFKRRLGSYQFIDEDSQSPEINCPAVARLQNYFRRVVEGCSGECGAFRAV